jgi:hypothetical protein
MIAPPKPPWHDGLEALIKEARARRRRRQAAAVAVVAFASAAAFVGYSLAGGHAPTSQSNPNPARPVASASSTACSRGKRPRLLLSSRTSGAPGTAVSVVGCSCTHPQGQADRLGWLDSREMLKDPKTPPGQLWRRIPLIRTSRKSARAIFVVRQSDSTGRGLLDMWCGPASNGNAIAWFTVTG